MENNQMPFFSVIIPTFNRAYMIRQTLESVLNQSYPGFEIIVVDDGSTDNTEDVVRKLDDPKIHYYKKKHAERAAARNFGMDKAIGEYVTFVDSDDYYYPWYLSHAYQSIHEFEYPKFLHLAYEMVSQNKKTRPKFDFLKNDDISIFIKGNPLSCMGVFIKRSITKEFRFNEDIDLSGSEDWELWIRIAAHYGIKTDNRISGAVNAHSERSVLNFDEQKLLKRKLLSLQYAFQDEKMRSIFSKNYRQVESYCDSYIALHLVLSRKIRQSIKYLLQAVRNNLEILFTRRFLAIVKHSFLFIFK